jgi:hypothetical protein
MPISATSTDLNGSNVSLFAQQQDQLIISEMEKFTPSLRNTSAVLKKISELTGHKPSSIASRYEQVVLFLCLGHLS